MRNLITALVFLLPMAAFAQDATQDLPRDVKVEITTFYLDKPPTNLGELCGRVTGLTAPAVVRITVDPKTKNPAIYNAVVDKDGAFCSVVMTFEGNAMASVWGFHSPLVTASIRGR